MLHHMWAILIMTLPAEPKAVRLRIWRHLKSLGCEALRDGAYLLPATHAAWFDPLAGEVREHGGTALVMVLTPQDETQRQEVEQLFDRTQAYAAWRDTVAAWHQDLAALGETEARRRLRGIGDALASLQRIDHYPGQAAVQADADLSALRQALDARFSKGEPVAQAPHGIQRLVLAKFQDRCWATRARPWVDRLACAWLIRRFIDAQARFVWLADPVKTPRGALGFDFDGARFTHVGARVSFEVLAASFGLDADPQMQRLGRLVHYLDVGGIPVSEAAGLEAVLAGLRELHADDDQLMNATAAVFDALYASPSAPVGIAATS